jgi:hypothetical protein
MYQNVDYMPNLLQLKIDVSEYKCAPDGKKINFSKALYGRIFFELNW